MKSAIFALALTVPWSGASGAVADQKAVAERGAVAETKEDLAGVEAPSEDLDAIQGLWVRKERVGLFGSRRITKQIKGAVETVTYYDDKGNVERANTVTVKLRRAGPIKVFVFTDYKVIAGPSTGYEADWVRAYIYKVVDDTFVEIWGVLGDKDEELEVHRWKHVKAVETTEQAEKTES